MTATTAFKYKIPPKPKPVKPKPVKPKPPKKARRKDSQLAQRPTQTQTAPTPYQPTQRSPKASGRSPTPLKLIELENWHCRWPINRENSCETLFCGRLKVTRPDGKISAYCVYHYAIAYRP